MGSDGCLCRAPVASRALGSWQWLSDLVPALEYRSHVMANRTRTAAAAAVLMLATLGSSPSALAQQGQNGASAIEPDAVAALKRMQGTLRTLSAFSLRSDTTIDEVTEDGMKLQFGGTLTMQVRRPNGLHAEVKSDRKQRQLFYDGKSLTLYGAKAGGYYAIVPAPATLKEVADAADQKYGIRLPLADLFYWSASADALAGIKEAALIGPSRIGNVMCDHIAIRQEGLDWQVWIAQGKAALPQKLVITTLGEASQPQYVALMQWNTAPKFDAGTFRFVPPKGAHPIKLVELDK